MAGLAIAYKQHNQHAHLPRLGIRTVQKATYSTMQAAKIRLGPVDPPGVHNKEAHAIASNLLTSPYHHLQIDNIHSTQGLDTLSKLTVSDVQPTQRVQLEQWVKSVANTSKYPAIKVSQPMTATIKDYEMANMTIQSTDFSVCTHDDLAHVMMELAKLPSGLTVMDIDSTVAAFEAAKRAAKPAPTEAIWTNKLVPRLKANVMSAGSHLTSEQRKANMIQVWFNWHGCTDRSILSIEDTAQRLMAAHEMFIRDVWAQTKAAAEAEKGSTLSLEEETDLFQSPVMDLPRALEVESISRVQRQKNEWLHQVYLAHPEAVSFLREAGTLELTHTNLGTITWCCLPKVPKSELIIFDLQTPITYLADQDTQHTFLQQVLAAAEDSYASVFTVLPEVKEGVAAAQQAQTTAAAEADAAHLTPISKAAKVAAAETAANPFRADPDIDDALYDEEGVPLAALNKEQMNRKTQAAVRVNDMRTAALILTAAPLGKLPGRIVSASLHSSNRIKGLKLNVNRSSTSAGPAMLAAQEQVAKILAAAVAVLDSPGSDSIEATTCAVNLSTSTGCLKMLSDLRRLKQPLPKAAPASQEAHVAVSFQDSLAQRLLAMDESALLAAAAVEAAASTAVQVASNPPSAALTTEGETAPGRKLHRTTGAASRGSNKTRQKPAAAFMGTNKSSKQASGPISADAVAQGRAAGGNGAKHLTAAPELQQQSKPAEVAKAGADSAHAAAAAAAAQPVMRQQRIMARKSNQDQLGELRGKNPDVMLTSEQEDEADT